jgi:hypothetical protein
MRDGDIIHKYLFLEKQEQFLGEWLLILWGKTDKLLGDEKVLFHSMQRRNSLNV